MANENNRCLSEDQAQHLPPRPATGGTAGIENSSNRAVVATTGGIYFRGGRTRNLLCL